ncbi:hypothetical protein PAEPH01_1274 [Pancytospora epiphaga]|nr:hypothetical protein PAEPH01_1274 [Pancytospora epiphaga]
MIQSIDQINDIKNYINPSHMKTFGKTYTCLIVVDKWHSDHSTALSFNNFPVEFKNLNIYNLCYSFVRLTNEPCDPGQPSSTNIVVALDEIGKEEIYYQRIENTCFDGHISVCNQMNCGFVNEFKNIVKIGHRGCGANSYGADLPENTIESFLEAKKRGAQAIELDVHLTLDNILVVNHDEYIGGLEIQSKSYKELCEAFAEQSIKVLSLEEVLRALPDDFGVNIESKSSPIPLFGFSNYLGRMAIEVMMISRKYSNKKILFSSFSLTNCIYLKMLNSACKVCLIVNSGLFVPTEYKNLIGLSIHEQDKTDGFSNFVPEHLSEINKCLVDLSNEIAIDGFVFDSRVFKVNPGLIEALRETNKELYCYGRLANNYKESKNMLENGFFGLITDDLIEIEGVLGNEKLK